MIGQKKPLGGAGPLSKSCYHTNCQFSCIIGKEACATKTSKFTEGQIIFALKQVELGMPVKEVVQKVDII